MQNRIFLGSFQKNCFLQNIHFGSIRWVPRRFFKILINYGQNLHFNLVFLSNTVFENYSMHMLSICKNDFIAH
jgi:hypothetical protein